MSAQTFSDNLQHWFSKLTSNRTCFFAVLDRQHHYVIVSQRYADIAQQPIDQLIGQDDHSVLGEEYYQALQPLYELAFQGEYVEKEIEIQHINGNRTFLISVSPLNNGDDIESIIFQAFDTSEKQALLQSLDESERKFLTLSSILTDGVLLVENNTIISANPVAVQQLGFEDVTVLLGEEFSKLFLDKKTGLPVTAHSSMMAGQTQLCQTSIRCGLERTLRLTSAWTVLWGNRSQIVLIQDTTSPSSYTFDYPQPLDVHIDPLTEQYNRLGFTKRVEQYIKTKTPFVMLYLDVDNFKNINDSLGHHVGDKVIREVAARLKRLLPTQAILGHLGADEFAIIWPNAEYSNAEEALAERIISLINQPFDLQHFSKHLSCSIGSVRYPENGNSARVLLQNADTAMYEAKARGRNRLVVYTNQMSKEARTRLWLEIELQKALMQNGLEVWYQPKVSARDFSINGAEALVRWKHPVEGYISPSAFIPVAEQSGLIEHLGKVVIREVFTTVKHWQKQGILPGRVAINLSPEQFGNTRLLEYLDKQVNITGVDPSWITFELTETAVMSDSKHTLQMLNAIKQLGFALSIDDFGTGYSSLAYLARFPLDELKIDREFINDIDTLPKQVTVIENIINLGKSLELSVVAEGVETQQQATLLSNLSCNTIQGFHFYRPLPKNEVEELFIKNVHHIKGL
ncbi:EAL domain-containing protein [Vibrio sp. CAIM 722]|uniref:EAL domain-containing protein n=1 Tax=Vibrio eleionomae TaxID=2653505 RepID=A0A7X4LIY3_9VIBR|nr:EAL domain-containing protein [Vibrio eleionomae]MZI92600.1 EAL domain-containing protein [Vibrio eleionomae]